MLLDEDPATVRKTSPWNLVLSVVDPIKLIHVTISNFNIHPDKAAIGRINESLSTLQQARSMRIGEAEKALKKLSRNLSNMTTQHNETLFSHNTADHASQIVELDTQKFRIAKAASDLEIESERLEQELEGLKGRLHDLDIQGVEGSKSARARREQDDPILLKLKIYRSLGIDVDPDSAGNYNKAVIRNSQKGDVHVVNIDPKFSSRDRTTTYMTERTFKVSDIHGNAIVMPRHRPATSGYARIAQADEENGYADDPDDADNPRPFPTISTSVPQYAPIQPQPHGQMYAGRASGPYSGNKRSNNGKRRIRRRSSGVDIKAINARLERWAEEIASKFKINRVRGKTAEEEQLEIQHSVFQAPEGMRPASAETLASDFSDEQDGRMTKLGFDDVVESVKVAIELGVHPKMISQGSSGSYFARNSEGEVVGVFKPKDEEPYASRNPKWTKWIHRNLFPCFFGRECLIPNLSYVSEAAAFVLDTRLRTHLVPYTDIVYLSSKSFYYDFWDRSTYYRKRKPLPAKVGSFQVFLKGFKDANLFLRDHPWPDQANSGFRPQDAPKRKKKPWGEACRPNGAASDDEIEATTSEARSTNGVEGSQERAFTWTETLQQSFREELEKLVILDYIMRNTDRGLDNWMIRVNSLSLEVTILSEPPKMNGITKPHLHPVLTDAKPYKRQESMKTTSGSGTPSNASDLGKGASISIGAIDNSLSWPWKHPDAWRSFPFGWLFLPVSLIGQPFSQKSRDHFLPLLTSKQWWSETQTALRRVFSQDSDFKERMFARQIAVMKGQAWNVVETLKTPDHGPLELTRRARVCVWDDLVDIPVAIPMRVPSAEVRRRRDVELDTDPAEEEMDISTVNDSGAKPQPDLLGLSSPANDLPNPNRFDLTHDESSSDLGQFGPESPATVQGLTLDHDAPAHDLQGSHAKPERPGPPRSRTRVSYETHRKHPSTDSARRRYSHANRYGSSAFFDDPDDLEGDLGYAAAEGMEGHQRKVIVERLETVKSKNPVFTWC